MTLAEAKNKIDSVLAQYASLANPASLVAPSFTSGKMYEAWVLGYVLQRLEIDEGYSVRLVGGSKVHLKSSPGPINRDYPRFELLIGSEPKFEVWTDIEFATLSYSLLGHIGTPGSPHRHELDVVVVPAGTNRYPRHDEISIGIECKNTTFDKGMSRAALGVRRELSYLRPPTATGFTFWPTATVPADPPSVLMVFSTDPTVSAYNESGAVFGVVYVHEVM